MKSDRTKQCQRRKWLFRVLHLLCLFGPFIYFIPYAYATGKIASKLVMNFTVITSLIMAILSLLIDVKNRNGMHRVILWLLIAGVMFCLSEVKTFIWIMTVTSILDELIFVKLKDFYRMAEISNKEIDKRS